MSKISICIPTYNQPVLLKRLLDSIYSQDFTDFEVIITDDSTDDAVHNVVLSYSDSNILYVRNSPSLGPGNNWNRAMELATSDVIKIMHQDDFFTYSYSLSRMYEKLITEQSDFVFCGTREYFDENNFYFRSASSKQEKFIKENIYNLYKGNYIGAPSATIFRKGVCKFDSNLKWLIDIDFYISYLQSSSNFIRITEPLISIGRHFEQTTQSCINNKDLMLYEYTYMLKKYNLQKKWNFVFFFAIYLANIGIPRGAIVKEIPFSMFPFFLIYFQNLLSLPKRILKKITKVVFKIFNYKKI